MLLGGSFFLRVRGLFEPIWRQLTRVLDRFFLSQLSKIISDRGFYLSFFHFLFNRNWQNSTREKFPLWMNFKNGLLHICDFHIGIFLLTCLWTNFNQFQNYKSLSFHDALCRVSCLFDLVKGFSAQNWVKNQRSGK